MGEAVRTRIGTAGWSIPSRLADAFPKAGTHLARYAGRLQAVEINSSFYRSHRPATYARWARDVPEDFRFSVKMPKAITHEARLVSAVDRLRTFAGEIGELGDKLGVVLVQTPPSVAFERSLAETFFDSVQGLIPAPIAFEPRHRSWFAAAVDQDLSDWRIARVAADPPIVPGGDAPGGWRGLTYIRLHGAPRIYYSAYDQTALAALKARLAAETAPTWCIFDNTAAGAAWEQALEISGSSSACSTSKS